MFIRMVSVAMVLLLAIVHLDVISVGCVGRCTLLNVILVGRCSVRLCGMIMVLIIIRYWLLRKLIVRFRSRSVVVCLRSCH